MGSKTGQSPEKNTEKVIPIPLNYGPGPVATQDGLAGSTGQDVYPLIVQLFAHSSFTE